MRDISREQRLALKNMLSEITLELNNKMTDFTDNILLEGKENNKWAMNELANFKTAFKKSEDFVHKCIRSFETKIGRVQIDFDRLSGDTSSVCEALASGLQEVRKGQAGQKQYLVDLMNDNKSRNPYYLQQQHFNHTQPQQQQQHQQRQQTHRTSETYRPYTSRTETFTKR